MKIGVFSDQHLGNKPYGLQELEEDFYKAFNKCIDIFLEEKVDLVLSCGDLFENPKMAGRPLKVFQDGIMRLEGIPIVNVVGNHTKLQVRGSLPVDYLFEDVCTFVNLDNSRGYKFRMDNVIIYGIPYHSKTQKDKLIELMNELEEDYLDSDADYGILLLHQATEEQMPYGFEINISDIPTGFDKVYIGHLHSRIDVNDKISYVGSIERSSITEAVDYKENGKGVTILDTDKNQQKFIDLELERDWFRHSLTYENIEDKIKELPSSEGMVLHLNVSGTDIDREYLYDLVDVHFKEALKSLVTIELVSCDEEEIEFDKNTNLDISAILKKRIKESGLEEHLSLAMDLLANRDSKENMKAITDDYFDEVIKDGQS